MAANRTFTALWVLTFALTGLGGCFADEPAPASASASGSSASTTGPATEPELPNASGVPMDPPVAAFTVAPANASETNLTAGTDLIFNASESSDPAGGTLTYSWDFGDDSAGEGVSPNHTFGSAGNYTVVLTVTSDASGQSANASQVIEIKAPPVMEKPRIWQGTTTGSSLGGPCLTDYTYFNPKYYVGWTYKLEPATFKTDWWTGNNTKNPETKSSGTVPEGADNVGACTGSTASYEAAWKITVFPPGYKP